MKVWEMEWNTQSHPDNWFESKSKYPNEVVTTLNVEHWIVFCCFSFELIQSIWWNVTSNSVIKCYSNINWFQSISPVAYSWFLVSVITHVFCSYFIFPKIYNIKSFWTNVEKSTNFTVKNFWKIFKKLFW